MTLGNANVWYHMQSISLHTFNMCFYCLCACVFFHICCLWHCPSVSQIKPLAKRGSQHRCTGQLALQKHAAGWCHWGDGSVDLFPRFQGILVFKKFEELVYVGVLGGSRLKTPWQKGFIFLVLPLPKFVFQCLVSMSVPTFFNPDLVLLW